MKDTRKKSPSVPFFLAIVFGLVAGALWWLFYIRFYKYMDCIAEITNGSCPDDSGMYGVTSAGIFWGIFALPATCLAVVLFYVALYRFLIQKRRPFRDGDA